MNIELLTKTDLVECIKGLTNEIKEIKKITYQKHIELIPSEQIPGILHISQKTWQNYRDNKVIPFVQYGQKIWVRSEDLTHFIESNTVK